ncbi:C-reactive protein 1.1-like [Tachypleus tridentatus]|uniref:C-reactive protein 1.1-like n=1 Tax=Tachypleus tridentatus TaxID=6853 RepID=UPI003FD62DB8
MTKKKPKTVHCYSHVKAVVKMFSLTARVTFGEGFKQVSTSSTGTKFTVFRPDNSVSENQTLDIKNWLFLFYAHPSVDNEFILGISVKNDFKAAINLFVHTDHVSSSCSGVRLGHWYHVCAVWSGADGSNKIFLNGEQCSQTQPLKPGHRILGGGTVVIGQEQDKPGGGFESSAAWEGELTDLQVWNEALTEEQIKKIAPCDEPHPRGNLLSWMKFPFVAEDGVIFSSSQACDP